ncbi:MAG TPA: DNA-binding protein Alba [Candidatus Acidoferrales bacterium]|jgi:DNA-binding protein|nr:DNA-binding protein Alba [Candidatus Acidoferrales bacterium]
MTDDNIIYVGNKPVMNYVLAVVTQFNNGADEVLIKARGRAISRAVDVAEISRKRFLSEVNVKDISISTESLATENGDTNVSAIEITVGK